MAPTDVVRGDGKLPSSVEDSKPGSNHFEDAESCIKEAQLNDERVILTEQDVSPSSQYLHHKVETTFHS